MTASGARVAGVHGRPSAIEWAVLAAITAVAVVARAWAFGGAGMEHYDEGVYAISATAVAAGTFDLFPNQLLFSPPFFFGTVGFLARLFGGAPDRVAVLLNVVLGSMTVVATWWIARRWFSPRAAVVAASMLALSSFHILMSRVVLTDVAFALWFVLALGVMTDAIVGNDWRRAVLAGLLTGVAWNTKYHGWFVLLIAGVALVPDLWRGRRTGEWRQPLAIWATAAGVAVLCYLPWAIYMQGYSGGYTGVVSYYSDMLGTHWLRNARQHIAQQVFLETTTSRAAVAVALAAGLLLEPGRRTGTVRFAAIAVALATCGALLGLTVVAALLAVAALPALLREFATYRARVLICWVGLWAVAAPVYKAYPRLLLPATVATMILAGWTTDRFVGTGVRQRATWPVLGVAVVLAIIVALSHADIADPWRASRGMAAAADSIAARTMAADRIYVVGEPPVVHYLDRKGRRGLPSARLADFDTVTGPVYLVTGRYTGQAPQLRTRFDSLRPRLQWVATYHVEPNDLRLLDDLRPHRAREFRTHPDSTFDLSLYRVLAAGTDSSARGTR